MTLHFRPFDTLLRQGKTFQPELNGLGLTAGLDWLIIGDWDSYLSRIGNNLHTNSFPFVLIFFQHRIRFCWEPTVETLGMPFPEKGKVRDLFMQCVQFPQPLEQLEGVPSQG